MGICASCLGLSRSSRSEESESSQLLGDSYQPQYGGASSGEGLVGPEPDPEDIKRERDALERLCTQTSDKLIDVAQISYSGQGSKMHDQYAILFNQIFPRTHPVGSSSAQTHETEQAWLNKILADNDRKTAHKWNTVEPIASGGLVMQFDEVLGMDKRHSKVVK